MLDLTPIEPWHLWQALGVFYISFLAIQYNLSRNQYAGHYLVIVGLISASLIISDIRLLFSLITAGVITWLIGRRDERRPLTPALQLTTQIIDALVMIAGGWSISIITSPFSGSAIFLTGIISIAISIGWYLVIINAINWLDGSDGLAPSVGVVTLFFLSLVTLLPSIQDPQTFALAVSALGAILAISLWNFPPAKTYLGTVGSWWLGITIASIAVVGGGKVVTTLLVLSWPIADFITVIIWRLRHGQVPWQGRDDRHLHHLLQKAGLSSRQIALVAIGFTVLMGCIAITLQTQTKIAALILASLAIFTSSYILIKHASKKHNSS